MFNARPKKTSEPRQDLLIPFLLGQRPELQDFIRNSFGSSDGISPPGWYQKVERHEIIEGTEMDKGSFIRLAGMFTGLIPADYLRKAHGRGT